MLSTDKTIRHLLSLDCCRRKSTYDKIFFANVTQSALKDIIYVNESGLYMYKYEKDNYHQLLHNSVLSIYQGFDKYSLASALIADIDSNGRDDLVLSGAFGLSIFSYDKYSNTFFDVFDKDCLNLEERSSKLLQITHTPKHSFLSTVISAKDNNMFFSSLDYVEEPIIKMPPDDVDLLPPAQHVFIKPRIVPKQQIKEIVLLRDQLDIKPFTKSVDTLTGKPVFQIPLVKLNAPLESWNLYYNGKNNNSPVGIGWNIDLSYIALYDSESVFPEDHNYYLFLYGSPQLLYKDNDLSTSDAIFFYVENKGNSNNDLKIKYIIKDELWEINTPVSKQYYGKSNTNEECGAISWTVNWKYYRGSGSDIKTIIKSPTEWYLCTDVSKQSKEIVNYKYYSIDVSIPGSRLKYTRETYLKSITDNENNSISFKYKDKTKEEYHLPEIMDENGILQLVKVQTKFLDSYNLISALYDQKINFHYDLKDKQRLLSAISQDGDYIGEPVLNFKYELLNDIWIMKSAVLPRGLTVNYSYNNLESNQHQPFIKHSVESDTKVVYGNDFIAISYLNRNSKIIATLFNSEMKQLMTTTLISKDIISHTPAQGENFYAIIIFREKEKEIHIFQKQLTETWPKMPQTINCSVYDSTSFGTNFLVIVKEFEVNIIEPTREGIWKISEKYSTNKKQMYLSVNNNKFAIYDDESLYFGYKNTYGKWIYKKVFSVAGLVTNTANTINLFDINSYTKRDLRGIFTTNSLQLTNNIILLYSWRSQNLQLYTDMHTFILDNVKDVAKHQVYNIAQDNLKTFSKEIDTDDGNNLTFGFEWISNVLKIVCKNIKGKFMDELEKNRSENIRKYPSQRDEINKNINQVISETKANITRDIQEKKEFILDLSLYLPTLRSNFIVLNNTTYRFTGSDWKIETVKSNDKSISHDLGSSFVLKQFETSQVKLYRKRNSQEIFVSNLEIDKIQNINIKYPKYLSYTDHNKTVRVIEFTENGDDIKKKYTLSSNEKMSAWSSYNFLITEVEEAGKANVSTLFIRNMKVGQKNSVVSKLLLNANDGFVRKTGYEYEPSSFIDLMDTIYYQKSKEIPGDDQYKFGLIEKNFDVNDSNNCYNNIYNGRGRLVKRIMKNDNSEENEKKKQKQIEEEANLLLNSTLTDKYLSLEIAQFYPYELMDEEVGYFGFEDYEKNEIGVNGKKWVFDEKGIIKNSFAYTGQNYLHISSGAFEGFFQPKNQDLTFIASCWIRPHNVTYTVGDHIPYFKITMTDSKGYDFYGILSNAKYQSGEWFYLETIIEYPYVRSILDNLNTNNTSYNKKLSGNIGMTLGITAGLYMSLDIDHIRLFPIDNEFEINVYENNKISAIIHNNGLISRNIHDPIIAQAGHINAYGILDKFTTKTKILNNPNTSYMAEIVIEPEGGFLEDFSVSTFENLWTISNSAKWGVAPRQLIHLGDTSDDIILNIEAIDHESFGIRFKYDFRRSAPDSKLTISNIFEITKSALKVYVSSKEYNIPDNGEVLWIVENGHCFIFVNGNLFADQHVTHLSKHTKIKFSIKNNLILYDFVVMKNPRIKITYSNFFEEKIQDILLEKENQVIIQQFLYDELGRQSITTEPVRLIRRNDLFQYHKNFVRNGNPTARDSIWKTGRILGLINDYNIENKYYGYGGVLYDDDSMENKISEGRPGEQFSFYGTYSKKFSNDTDCLYVNSHYPASKGYSYQVEHSTDNEVQSISVLNSKDHTIANYISVPGGKDQLTTYDVDDNGNLLKVVHPLYYDKLLFSLEVEDSGEKTPNNFTDSMSYDDDGNLISRITSDSAKIENIYRNKHLYFTMYYNTEEKVEKILYYQYDSHYRLIETGILQKNLDRKELEAILDHGVKFPDTIIYQQFNYGSLINEPILRNSLKRTITINGNESLVEESILDIHENILSKRIVISLDTIEDPLSIEIKSKYLLGKLKKLHYPQKINDEVFIISYEYNKLGQISGVGTPENPRKFATYEYNAAGLIVKETFLQNMSYAFTRDYFYNEPKFLTKISDKFMTEEISYVNGTYGGRIFGDGTVTKTNFTSTWHKWADKQDITINAKSFISPTISSKTSAICFNKLKEKGYIDDNGHQAKILYAGLEKDLPISCVKGTSGRYIAYILGSKGFPKQYGHTYDYGNYKEMTKAKYFVDDVQISPLQPHSFSGVSKLTVEQSIDIWKTLESNGYIIENRDTFALKHAHSKKGRSFFRSELYSDLKEINKDFGILSSMIENIVLQSYAVNKIISTSELEHLISHWLYPNRTNKTTIQKIWNMLKSKNYLSDPLSKEFKDNFEQYSNSTVASIVGVLLKHEATELGQAEFDIESYDIDANGNHKFYYTGYERFEMEYNKNNNQIRTIKKKTFHKVAKEMLYEMDHDCYGNVIKSLHKGIKNIEYDKVSNRIIRVTKVNGLKISFRYDALGYRVSKRVTDVKGKFIREVQYIRDSTGRVLSEKDIHNVGNNIPHAEILTVYVYGPKSLLGFFRFGKYFTVLTDHEGSTRLVIQDGKVVAAYDYLPYGGIMRQLDPKGLGIRYR